MHTEGGAHNMQSVATAGVLLCKRGCAGPCVERSEPFVEPGTVKRGETGGGKYGGGVRGGGKGGGLRGGCRGGYGGKVGGGVGGGDFVPTNRKKCA